MTRPPNKICPVCGRKSLAPEKDGNEWRFPPKKICFNCTSLQYKVFDEINANRRILIKSLKESEAVFPLLILDISNNHLVGKFNDFKTLRKGLNLYRANNLDSDIKIIDKKYHDFTDYFSIKS